MNKIPTAEKFARNFSTGKTTETPAEYIKHMLIEFAKLHCRAQLTAILSNVTIKHYNAFGQHDPHVDCESIDKAYSLENIN